VTPAPRTGGTADLARPEFVVGVTAIAAVLLALSIGEKGLWLDEALSVQRASLDWRSLWTELSTTQANMGLYYILLKAWVAIAGTTEAAVRSLSAVIAVATLPLVYFLARRIFDARSALAGVALLAFNSFFIRYGQEARGYSLLTLLVVASTWAFVRALDRPESRLRWVAYVVTGTLAVYAHFFGALVALAHAVWLVRERPREAVWRALGAWLAIAALAAPILAFVLFKDVGQIDWIPTPRAIDALHVLRQLSGDAGWWLLGLYGAACALALGRSDSRARLLWVWLLVPFVVAFGLSAFKPIVQSRYLIVVLPPLAMLAGAGIARVRSQPLAGLMLSVALVLSAIGVRDWRHEADRQYWRHAARHVMANAQPGDAVGFYVYSARVPFEYYLDRLGLRRPDVDLVDLASTPYIAGPRQPEPSAAVLEALATGPPRVWLVRLQDGAPAGHPLRRHEQIQAIETGLGRTRIRSVDVSFPGGIRVQRFDR
jgi:mannosyltransferase